MASFDLWDEHLAEGEATPTEQTTTEIDQANTGYVVEKDGRFYRRGEWIDNWRQADIFVGGAATNALCEANRGARTLAVKLEASSALPRRHVRGPGEP